MSEGKLIEVKFREKLLPITERKNYCDHHNVEVDPEARILSCVKCEAFVDPFEYILQLAYNERSVHAWIEQLEKERQQLWNERDKLKSQVSYWRRELKKLKKPETNFLESKDEAGEDQEK